MSKPKMTCAFTRVVRIEFRGYRLPGDREKLIVPRDDGMVKKIFDFLNENNINSATTGGTTGGGIFIKYFFEEDAKKIVDFLASQGVEVIEEYGYDRGI